MVARCTRMNRSPGRWITSGAFVYKCLTERGIADYLGLVVPRWWCHFENLSFPNLILLTTHLLARLKNYLKFRVEQLLLRGAHSRLLFIASLIGVVAVGGGLMVQATDAPFDDSETAIWWAFLRLTDPGYLGDDEGLARRVISTVVTVLGYVLFMGSLIAIMTQWLNQTIRNRDVGMSGRNRAGYSLAKRRGCAQSGASRGFVRPRTADTVPDIWR